MTLNDATPSERATRAGDPAHPTHLSVVQVVRSDAFAGVERYICQVANELVRRGHHVVAIGGDPGRMRTELRPKVAHVRPPRWPRWPRPCPANARPTWCTST